MAVSQLVEGGYCNSISNRQPFVIGIDFRPPVPAGWFLPRIRPSADVLQELMECLERAGAVTKIDAESSEIPFSERQNDNAKDTVSPARPP